MTQFSYYNDEQFLKTSITGFMTYILEQVNIVKDLIEKGDISKTKYRKYNLLSGHDSTISSMLIAAKARHFNVECLLKAFEDNATDLNFTDECERYPPLATSFAFEIVTSGTADPKLRFNFNGDYFDFCSMKNPSENYVCDFDTFNKVVNSMIVPDLHSACFLEPEYPITPEDK